MLGRHKSWDVIVFGVSKVWKMFCNFATDSRILAGSQAFLYHFSYSISGLKKPVEFKWNCCSLKCFHNMNKSTFCYFKHKHFYLLLLLSVTAWPYSPSILTLYLFLLSLPGPSLTSVVDSFSLAAASIYAWNLSTCTENLSSKNADVVDDPKLGFCAVRNNGTAAVTRNYSFI